MAAAPALAIMAGTARAIRPDCAMALGLHRTAEIAHWAALEVFSVRLQHDRLFPGRPESVPKKLQIPPNM
jgi:hypothetical protein